MERDIREAQVTEILVRNDELLTVREAMREMNRHVGDLNTGQREKLVLTQRNRMCAVVISAERYAELVRTEQELLELKRRLGQSERGAPAARRQQDLAA